MSDKDISVFVDESGSFAPDSNSSRYYLICLVLHDQAADISESVSILEDSLDAMGLGRNHCIHAGPLVRREKEYAGMRRFLLKAEAHTGIFLSSEIITE